MNIFDETKRILDSAGYRTKFPVEKTEVLYFEDDSLFGSINVFDNVDALLSNWQRRQEDFLKINAIRIRNSPKAWNAYSIFLTPSGCGNEERTKLLAIEEDFRGTRKIARSSVFTRQDLIRALLPLLPIQYLVTLISGDSMKMLRTRLNLSEVEKSTLLGEYTPREVVSIFLGEAGEE